MSTDIRNLRNIVLVGHGGTGKTSLTEQILFNAKAIPRAERPETGRTVSDHTEEEIKRGCSLHTSLAHFSWKDTKFNLLDTPGAPDFAGEVIAGLRSAESALMVIGARSGVQIETVKLWRYLDNHQMPRMVFINKVDKAASDYWKTLEELKEKFKQVFIPVTIPLGHDQEHAGVINLLDMKAYPLSALGQYETATPIPPGYQEEARQARQMLMEEAAEGDEELLEKYASNDTLTEEEIKKGLREGLENNQFVPVFCGSALLNSGIVPFLDFASWDSPSPFQVVEPCVSGEKALTISPEGPFTGLIFKTVLDQFAGKLSYVKVVTGTLRAGQESHVPRLEKSVKLGRIFVCLGKKLIETDSLGAGDLGIIAKTEELKTGDSLGPADHPIHFLPLELPRSVHAVSIKARSQKDEDRFSQILQRAGEQDPTFCVEYRKDTRETVVSVLGDLQLQMVLDRLRDAKIPFETGLPRISYRETITKSAEAEYTHKKQTGGHGQYAKVMMDFQPLARGEGFRFTHTLKGQNISKGYLPAVEKGIQEAMEEGFLAGFPLIDLGANISDGKEHPVDSSELAFKLAARGAFLEALTQAKPIILEPVMNLQILIEEKYLGEILADLAVKKGRVLGQESIGKDILAVRAQVPHAELLQYAIQLKALTSGTGAFELDFDHYSPLGARETEILIKDYQAKRHHE